MAICEMSFHMNEETTYEDTINNKEWFTTCEATHYIYNNCPKLKYHFNIRPGLDYHRLYKMFDQNFNGIADFSQFKTVKTVGGVNARAYNKVLIDRAEYRTGFWSIYNKQNTILEEEKTLKEEIDKFETDIIEMQKNLAETKKQLHTLKNHKKRMLEQVKGEVKEYLSDYNGPCKPKDIDHQELLSYLD